MTPSSSDHPPVQAILNTLLVLQSHLALYGHDNDNVTLTTSRLFVFLERYFSSHETFVVQVTRHGFLYNKAFIDRRNQNFEKFAYRLFQHGIAAFRLTKDVQPLSVHTFLTTISRKQAETWDEGGILACLRHRNVTGIDVKEMVDSDFLLTAETSEDTDLIVSSTSRLWETFARELLLSLGASDHSPDQLADPGALAEEIKQSLDNSDRLSQATVARDASRFLLTLKHENIVLYRRAALQRLIAFVEHLDPELRQRFLSNTFNLNLSPELAEEFFAGLSDKVILEALQYVADSDTYAPPVVVKLLGKLAKSRELTATLGPEETGQNQPGGPARVKDLFKPDDFKKYVPEDYQRTLFTILGSDTLPTETGEHIEHLKQTLEQDLLDSHMGAVLFEILQQDLDANHLKGLASQLVETLGHYLDAGDFSRITRLYRKCLETAEGAKQFPVVVTYLQSPRFTNGILDAARHLSRTRGDEILELIVTIRQPFIAPLLDRLSTEKDRTLRMFCLNALKKIGAQVVAPALERLTDDRWFVLRNLLLLVREMGDSSALPPVRNCMHHPHPKVAEEALMTCLAFNDRLAEELLLKRLDTEKGPALLKAIMLAGMTNSDPVVARLLAFLESSAIFDYQLDIRVAAVRSLAVSTPHRALSTLAEVLASRRILHNREHKALQIEALKALSRFPAEAIRHIIDSQLTSKVPEIARQAAAIQAQISRRED